MQTPIGDQYLLNELTTATPQRLHLLLIEAAIRHARRADECWKSGHDETAGEAVIRAQEIVGEIMAGLRADLAPDLVPRVSAVYGFVFRTLVRAHVEHNSACLADAIRVLEVEAETWRQVCQQLASAPASAEPACSAPLPGPHRVQANAAVEQSVGGFSLEA